MSGALEDEPGLDTVTDIARRHLPPQELWTDEQTETFLKLMGRHNLLMTTEPFDRPPYPGDCGLDLTTTEDIALRPGESANVHCGVKVALPSGTFGWITGRSSTWVRWGLWVMPGIIDEGWRGELLTLVWRPPIYPDPRPMVQLVPKGTRLAQLVILPNLLGQVHIQVVRELPESERGEKGFGSSG